MAYMKEKINGTCTDAAGEVAFVKKETGVFQFMAGLVIFTLIFAAASVLVGVVIRDRCESLLEARRTRPLSASAERLTVIIDAGHGGEDGGCFSGDVLEKDLNLLVSENIYDLCVFMGIPAEMTRTEDKLLYDMYGDLEDYTGKKKTYDLRNRLRFAAEKGGVYLGIHMNKFPMEQYSGLQVYYSANHSDSRLYAEKIQAYTREYLQPENSREIKKATRDIYVLSKAEQPAVLVECGFLSNSEELGLLTNGEYRKKLALELVCAVAETGGEAG